MGDERATCQALITSEGDIVLKRIFDITRTLTFGVILIYVTGLFVFLALRLNIGDGTWWMGFLNNFAHWAFLPAFFLLLAAFILRAWRGVLLVLPAIILALVWYAPYFAPRARAALPVTAPQLRIATFNTWGRNRAHAESAGYEAIGDWLRTLDADLILLQEVPISQRTREDGVLGLGDLYPDQFSALTERWVNVTLTRLPVIDHVTHLPKLRTPSYQRTVVEFEGQQIAIYTVHNNIPFREEPRFLLPIDNFVTQFAARYDPTLRDTRLRSFLELLRAETLPFVVGGDFNMSDQSLIYGEVAVVMNDSFRSAGWGFGTSWRVDVERQGRGLPPLIRIDYLWHSDEFVALTSEQGPFLGSDHLPLMSTLALVQPGD